MYSKSFYLPKYYTILYEFKKKSLRISRVHTKKLAGQMVKSKDVFASCQKICIFYHIKILINRIL